MIHARIYANGHYTEKCVRVFQCSTWQSAVENAAMWCNDRKNKRLRYWVDIVTDKGEPITHRNF